MNDIFKSVHYGSGTLSYLGSKIWDLLPENIKDSENINIFDANSKGALLDLRKFLATESP